MSSTSGEGAVLHDINRHPELASFYRNLLISCKMGPLGVVSGFHVFTSATNLGKTLSRIAKICSRSLSNSALSQGERKFALFPLLGEGKTFAKQTEMNLSSYRPNILTTSNKLDCHATARNDGKPQTVTDLTSYRPNVLTTFKDSAIADRASLVRNDEICHPELVSGSHTLRKRSFASLKMTSVGHSEQQSHKLDCFARPADGGNRARNDVTTLVPQYLSALVPSKKAAFTLAEVLITLGVIGVVAAMTMPTVVANYQKKVLETQLKKSVSVLQNGFKKIMADEEVDNIYNTTISDATSHGGYYYWGIKGNKAAELMHLEPVSQGSKFYEMMHDDSLLYNYEGFNNCYYLPSGACVAFTEGGKAWSYGTENTFYVLIDVNCDRGPNLNSKDIFIFMFGGKAQIVHDSYLDDFMENIDEFCKNLNNYSDEEKLLADWYSLYCGYSIMKNGWKFVY